MSIGILHPANPASPVNQLMRNNSGGVHLDHLLSFYIMICLSCIPGILTYIYFSYKNYKTNKGVRENSYKYEDFEPPGWAILSFEMFFVFLFIGFLFLGASFIAKYLL